MLFSKDLDKQLRLQKIRLKKALKKELLLRCKDSTYIGNIPELKATLNIVNRFISNQDNSDLEY